MTRKSIKGIERRLRQYLPKSYSTHDTIMVLDAQATWARVLLEGSEMKREIRTLKAVALLALERRRLLFRDTGLPSRLNRCRHLRRIIGEFGRLRPRAVKEKS